jgi:hypothetical protein
MNNVESDNIINIKLLSNHIKDLSKRFEVIQSLKNLFDNSTTMMQTGFLYSYGTLSLGTLKSIYNTNVAQLIKKESTSDKKYLVPMNVGYYSHLRQSVKKIFQNQTLPSEQLYFDVAHIIHLMKNFKLDFKL